MPRCDYALWLCRAAERYRIPLKTCREIDMVCAETPRGLERWLGIRHISYRLAEKLVKEASWAAMRMMKVDEWTAYEFISILVEIKPRLLGGAHASRRASKSEKERAAAQS